MILGLRGWTKTGFLDFQDERVLTYFMAFLLGSLCFKLKSFDTKSESRGLFSIVSSMAWLPITAYIVFLLYPWINPGKNIISGIIDRVILWTSYELSLLCLVYAMIVFFRRYLDNKGRIRSSLSENSYNIYIVHVIVMGILAMAMLDLTIPSPAKHLLLTVSTYLASSGIAIAIGNSTRSLQNWLGTTGKAAIDEANR